MRHKIRVMLMLVIVYFIVAMPFKVMTVIPGFTDVRPVMMLGPVYALFYDLPGCVVFALMNLVMDALSGELAWSSIAGLISNFLGPYLILCYWKRRPGIRLHLRTVGNIIHYSIVITVTAIFEAAIITPSVAAFYPEVDWLMFFTVVVLNTALFPILFGIPLMILMKEELGFESVI